MYKNVMEELKDPKDKTEKEDPVMDDYDLIAYSKMRVDFEYIVELLQGLVNYLDQTHDDFRMRYLQRTFWHCGRSQRSLQRIISSSVHCCNR